MLRIAIIDANERAKKSANGHIASVVPHWLRWEIARSKIDISDVNNADIIFLAFAGSIDWRKGCTAELRKYGIDIDPEKRRGRPYIITGGSVDATPLTALSVADALAIGEGVTLVRSVLKMIKNGSTVRGIADYLREYPHSIERREVIEIDRDIARPWLLSDNAPKIASPDNRVDWDIPHTKSSDNVVRVIAEKGCHGKCLFCATTYRQTHQQSPNGDKIRHDISVLKNQGERVQIVSNDPMNLPWFPYINDRLDSQSFTITEMANDANRNALIRNGIGIARFGVEGLSERIRRAFAKPIYPDKLLEILNDLHGHGINSHMFFISGAPYESQDDWDEFRSLYESASRVIQRGICRVKMTTFMPTPPAPLARYLPSPGFAELQSSAHRWIVGNAASRHMVFVKGRGIKAMVESVQEQYTISRDTAISLLYDNNQVDALPSINDALRAPWEIIDWPIRAEKRWKMAELYKSRMSA